MGIGKGCSVRKVAELPGVRAEPILRFWAQGYVVVGCDVHAGRHTSSDSLYLRADRLTNEQQDVKLAVGVCEYVGMEVAQVHYGLKVKSD